MFLKNSDLESYIKILKDFEINPNAYNLSDQKINNKLWQAKYAVKSAVNSETGKILPVPVRMCSFVPFNIPISFGMLCLPATFKNIIIFNFINQTYNAIMNYSNGSGTEDSIRYTAVSYTLAVVSSISTGLFLRRYFDRKKSINVIREGLVRIFPSCVAGFLNLFFMRSDYITKGINIKDEKGNVLGLSKICGSKAVIEGAFSRFFLPIPLFISHLFLGRVSKMKLPKKTHVAIEMTCCSLALGVGLPCSIAIFKENSRLNVKYLEKDLRDKLKESGIEHINYNKGL